jgi:osmotically-inducible protein OsmY
MGSHIDVAARDSEITLTGTVGTLRAKHVAERAARDVVGVHQVRNELEVKPASEPATKQLAENVVSAMGRDAYLGDDKITATANEPSGTVKLRGDVDSHYEATRAGQIAASMAGVKAIDNELTVAGRTVEHSKSWLPGYYHPFARLHPARGERTQHKNDTDLKSSIESEFFWSPFVDQDDVQVAVKDGVATLSGTVNDWGEHGAAIENAYEGGARTVKDQLKVKHGPAVHRP